MKIEVKYLPGVELTVLVVHQEEGGAVSIDQLLGLVHDLQDQSVHADHLLEYRPGNRNKVESTLERWKICTYWTTLRRKFVASLCLLTLQY